jgi:hypothetical protein
MRPIEGTYCPQCERAFVTEGTIFVTHNGATPAFFYNKNQRLLVLLARAQAYAHGGKRLSKHDFYSLDVGTVNAEATARAVKGYDIAADAPAAAKAAARKHQQAVERAGGYLQFQMAVATAVWTNGLNSFDAAAFLGIDARTVRQILHRLTLRAELFGFETRVLIKKRCKACACRLPASFVSLRSARLLKSI